MSIRKKERILAVINLLQEGAPSQHTVEAEGLNFTVIEHRTGWNFAAAREVIARYDGYADGIVLSGVLPQVDIDGSHFAHSASQKLVASVTRSRVYTGRELMELFGSWTLRRLFKEQPQFFRGKKTLFHSVAMTPGFNEIRENGAIVQAADPLVFLRLPLLLKGDKALKIGLRPVLRAVNLAFPQFVPPVGGELHPRLRETLRSWVQDCDVFVGVGGLLGQLGDFDVLAGKTVIADYIPDAARALLLGAGASRVLEVLPDVEVFRKFGFRRFSLLSAVIDQLREEFDEETEFAEYAIRMIEKENISPNRIEMSGPVVERVGFVIHPLSLEHIALEPKLKWIMSAPERVRSMTEQGIARLPGYHFGRITGIKSVSTGREAVCEVFVLPATPKCLKSMNEDFVYGRLADLCHKASQMGCSMMGLGAYTKVVGDAGVTVARRSPIPVTNGNSYSAAATLWAARVMVEKLGFLNQGSLINKKLHARAMVIGATGGIGRVSSLLLSFAFDDLILVATRADKLLELRDEIRALSPDTKVTIRTNPDRELPTTELIVTATSNIDGKILDIDMVRPGAVICDCSRPLDISREDALRRPDVLVIESGEIDLPGELKFSCDIGLPQPSVYACLAETCLLALEGRSESFSLGRHLSLPKVKEIYKIGLKHGAKLSAISGVLGLVTPDAISECQRLAAESRDSWETRSETVSKVKRHLTKKARTPK